MLGKETISTFLLLLSAAVIGFPTLPNLLSFSSCPIIVAHSHFNFGILLILSLAKFIKKVTI